MTSLRAYVEYPYERDGSLQSVCPLNARCKDDSASYCTNTNETVREAPKMSQQPVGELAEHPTFRENFF